MKLEALSTSPNLTFSLSLGPDSSDLKESQLKLRVNLFHKYLDHQPTRELQALFALQALIVKLNHPPGLLRKFFDVLYDEDIICEDSFNLWNNDTTEMQGKVVAMKSVEQFFDWLAEDDDEALDMTNEGPLTMEKIRVELDRSIVQKGLSNDELNAWIAVSGCTNIFLVSLQCQQITFANFAITFRNWVSWLFFHAKSL